MISFANRFKSPLFARQWRSIWALDTSNAEELPDAAASYATSVSSHSDQQAFSQLSPEWVAQVYQVAMQINVRLLQRLIHEIADAPDIALHLIHLLNRFDFESIPAIA